MILKTIIKIVVVTIIFVTVVVVIIIVASSSLSKSQICCYYSRHSPIHKTFSTLVLFCIFSYISVCVVGKHQARQNQMMSRKHDLFHFKSNTKTFHVHFGELFNKIAYTAYTILSYTTHYINHTPLHYITYYSTP